jgi:hypothetical protein
MLAQIFLEENIVVTTSVVRAGAPVWDYFSTNVLVSQVQKRNWLGSWVRAQLGLVFALNNLFLVFV